MTDVSSNIHPHRSPVYAWNPWTKPHVAHISLGADRFVDDPPPMPVRRPVGFTAPSVHEPLLWEGDGS